MRKPKTFGNLEIGVCLSHKTVFRRNQEETHIASYVGELTCDNDTIAAIVTLTRKNADPLAGRSSVVRLRGRWHSQRFP